MAEHVQAFRDGLAGRLTADVRALGFAFPLVSAEVHYLLRRQGYDATEGAFYNALRTHALSVPGRTGKYLGWELLHILDFGAALERARRWLPGRHLNCKTAFERDEDERGQAVEDFEADQRAALLSGIQALFDAWPPNGALARAAADSIEDLWPAPVPRQAIFLLAALRGGRGDVIPELRKIVQAYFTWPKDD
jgi:hypothetical protein